MSQILVLNNGDFEDWYRRTFGHHVNYATSEVLRNVARSAWEAATLVERERCAGIAGDIGAGLVTRACGAAAVAEVTPASVAFAVAKRIRKAA